MESQTAGGSSGQRSATPEQELLLTITTDSAHIKSIVKFLKDNNVRATYGYRNPPPPNDGYGTDDQLSVVLPVSLLARLAELPGVIRVQEVSRPGEVGGSSAPTPTLYLVNNGTPWPVDGPPVQIWKNLDYHLEQLYMESQTAGGSSGQRSATPEQGLLLTITTDPTHIKSIVKFLKDNNVRATYGYKDPLPPNGGYGTDDQLSVVLPVSLLAQLAELPGVVRVYEESGPGKVGGSSAPTPWPTSAGDMTPADLTVWHFCTEVSSGHLTMA